MLETPKGKHNQQFTSPIGLLKKYSSTQTPGAQFSNSKNNNYQQQFYKMKSQRLQTQLNETKQENSVLRSRLADSSAHIQSLKQKIYSLENNSNSSTVVQTERQKTSSGGEVQKLLKQIRILKNEHEIELVRLQDDNRKLKRKILQITTSDNKPNEDEDTHKQIYIKNQQQNYLKSLQQNQHLREDLNKYELKKQQMQIKNKQICQQNAQLRNQIDELKAMMSAKNRYQEKYNNLLTKYQEQSEQLQKLLQDNRQFLQSKYDKLERSPQNSYNQQRSSLIKPHQQIEQTYNEDNQSITSLNNRIRVLSMKNEQHQTTIAQKNQQIKNILQKLKPLLASNTEPKQQNHHKRASFSMLQIFLKKYKIASF